MKKNKFMTRVFSAMENQETEVLDQIQNDLEIAKEDGELDSEEYKITWDPDQEVFVLHDKINNEHTEISEDEEAAFYMTDMTDANEGIPTPEESIPELSVNDEVKWTDELGHEHQGMITMISDGIATILENEVEVAAPIESLMKVEAPVEEVAEVDYTFSEKVEERDFSFVEKAFAKVQDYYMVALDKETKLLHCKWLLETDKKSDAIEEYEKRSRTWTWDKNYKDLGLKSRDQITKIKGVDNINWYSSVGKTFSHIDSPESFREYAHKVMKQAHGDEYSEEVTNKVVDDLLADNPNNDYGELIGRLTSGFGEKEFSYDWSKNEKSAVVLKNPDGTHEVVSIQSEDDEERLKSYKEEGCRVVKRCKNTGEADKYIEEKSLTRAYSFVEKTFDALTKNAAPLESGTHRQGVDTNRPYYLYEIFYHDADHNTDSSVVIEAHNKQQAHWLWNNYFADENGATEHKYISTEKLEESTRRPDISIKSYEKQGVSLYSFIEKTFAKSDAVKKLEFEVSRIKDLYNDVKARQKGETDPVMKSRNKMLLQEIKVKLEQAKLAVYKKEFEESRSKLK